MLPKAALKNGACGDQISKSTPIRPHGKKWRRGQASWGRQVLHKTSGGGQECFPVAPLNPRVRGVISIRCKALPKPNDLPIPDHTLACQPSCQASQLASHMASQMASQPAKWSASQPASQLAHQQTSPPAYAIIRLLGFGQILSSKT